MFKDCTSLIKFINNDEHEKQKIDYDIPKIEKNENELKDNINTIDEDKGTLYEGLTKNKIYYDYSEVSNKETNSEVESIYLEILDSKLNYKSKEMIYKSESFISLYDKFNFDNIIDMSYMFYNCSSLLSLPDISKWNTNNVINMSFMFWNCHQLISSFPDISKWSTNNVNDMNNMFYNCFNLNSLPDISKWITHMLII